MREKIKSALIKISIDFAQILTLITDFNFNWPDVVINFFFELVFICLD